MMDAIDRRLRAADPLAGGEGGIPTPARLDAISEAIMDQELERAPRGPLTLARSLLIAGALLIAVPTAILAAAYIQSETPNGVNDTSGYQAEVAAAKSVTAIPPGATWPPHLTATPADVGSYGTGAGKQSVEMAAYCMWLGDWYTAHESGNAAEQATATKALEGSRNWTTFTDPTTTDEEFRAAHQRAIDAAVAGDASGVLHELPLCEGTWSVTK
jgi:hypothetical protein